MEIIFVEGNSSDNTWDEIQSMKDNLKKKNILLKLSNRQVQVKSLFLKVLTKQIMKFMILDGDLTVKPEELRKFGGKISSGEAEFVNGTRLIYPMEKDAIDF